jgi:MFS family permease
MVVNLGGMGSGPMLLSMGDPAGSNLFIIVSILFSIALVPILMTVGPMPEFETHRTMRLSQIIRDAPLGVVGCFITGVSNGAIIGLGAVYAEILGFTLTQVSLFMSSAILGGVLFQWPVGHASDIFDRRIVLTAVTFIASIAAAFTFAIKPGNILSYTALIGVLGGMSFPMYSLVLAMVNDRLTTDQMVAASSSLVLIVGIGAFLGAGAAGEAIDRMGAPGFMVLLSVIHASLGVFALYRMLIVPTVPLEQQGPPVYIPRTSPVAAAVAFEDTQEQTGEVTGDQDSH